MKFIGVINSHDLPHKPLVHMGRKSCLSCDAERLPVSHVIKPRTEGQTKIMDRATKNTERENRIAEEIIVDAYGPEEQAMGWYYWIDQGYLL